MKRVSRATLTIVAAVGYLATLNAVPAQAARPGESLAAPVSAEAVGFAESQPVRDLALQHGPQVDEEFLRQLAPDIEGNEVNELNTEGTGVEPNPAAPPQSDGALQTTVARGLRIPAPTLTFEGLSAADNIPVFGTTVAPPDTNGAVGPNDYVETTNDLVRVWDKNGNPRVAGFKLSSLFAPLGGLCASNDQGDPIVLYDRMANRWMISQFAFTGTTTPPYHQCIAVSKNGDPTGGYWVYDFITPGNEFPDYPKFGAWPDAYYYSDRQFTLGGPFNSFGVIAFNRAKMLVGDPTANFVYFNLGSPLPLLSNSSSGMIPTDFNGLTPPPAGAPNVFAVYTDDAFTGDTADTVRLFNFHADFAVPASSTFTERTESPVAVASFDSRNPSGRSDIEQPPPASLAADSLDSIGDRLMLRMQYINRGGTESLLLTHTVNGGIIPAPGILPTRAQYQAAMRYYEFRKTTPGGSYSVNEQATFGPGTVERWMGSAAMDNAGDIAVGYSDSNTTVFPSIAYAGRLAGDPPGGLAQGEATMFAGTGVQRGTGNRWGDYTALQLDPADDATFWMVGQYYTSTTLTFNWQTRIGRFKFAGTTAPAQGTLAGTVTACDSGVPLADATASVTGGTSSGFSSATNGSGAYSMNLTPDSYQTTIGDPAHSCSNAGPFTDVITNGNTTVQNACLGGAPKFAITSTAISGGNGDAIIDRDECVTLDLSIQNIGCLIAPGVTAHLTTGTSNVAITQSNSTFPTMNENAIGAAQVPFSVSTAPAFVCGTPIAFNLTITSPQGGSITLPFTLPTCTAPPTVLTGDLTAADLQQTARLGRNGITSTCPNLKASPGTLGAGNRSYDLYTFTNGPSAACVKIDTTANCPNATNPIITVAYLTSFNPANITQNYLGDPGGSPAQSNSFTVPVPASATLLVNVHEINQGTGCVGTGGASGYQVTVSNLIGNTDAGAVCVPCSIAAATDITVPNDANLCSAVVRFATPSTTGTCGVVTCSTPSGSTFPVGTTPVTCSTTAGPSTTFNVIVNDVQLPTVTAPTMTVPTDPNLCTAVVNFTSVATDNCPGVGVPVCAPPSGTAFPKGVDPVTCTVTDAHNNTNSATGSITVNDLQPPVLGACPANIQITLPPGVTQHIVDFTDPTVSDNCPGATEACAPPSGSVFDQGTTVDTCTGVDTSGNHATPCSFDVTLGNEVTQEIPTLSHRGLALLVLLLGAGALLLLRRRV